MILGAGQIVAGYPFLARRFRRIPLCDVRAVEQACQRADELAGGNVEHEPAAIFLAFTERKWAFPFAWRLMACHLAMAQARHDGLLLAASYDDLGALCLEASNRRQGWAEVRDWFTARQRAR